MKKTIFLQIIIILFLGINVDNLSAQNPSLSLDNISDNTDFQEKYEKAMLILIIRLGFVTFIRYQKKTKPFLILN
jgi:hypothetical protein